MPGPLGGLLGPTLAENWPTLENKHFVVFVFVGSSSASSCTGQLVTLAPYGTSVAARQASTTADYFRIRRFVFLADSCCSSETCGRDRLFSDVAVDHNL